MVENVIEEKYQEKAINLTCHYYLNSSTITDKSLPIKNKSISYKFFSNSHSENNKIKIGISKSCDVIIPSNIKGISNIQASIYYKDYLWFLNDGIDSKPSKNGTWISFKNDYFIFRNPTTIRVRNNNITVQMKN